MLIGVQAVPAASPSASRAGGQDNRPSFVPGELVTLRVQQAERPGSLIILIKGIPFQATSSAGPLKPGDVLQARVEETGGQVLLRLLDRPEVLPQQGLSDSGMTEQEVIWLKRLLPTEESFTVALDRLISRLRAVEQESEYAEGRAQLEALRAKIAVDPDALDGERLHTAFRALGLDYEHRLAQLMKREGRLSPAQLEPTLKAWLLKRTEATRTSPGALSSESWVKQAEQTLKTLDRAQVLNTLNLMSGQPLVFALPLSEGKGTLYIEREAEHQDAAGEPRHHFTTIVELDHFGKVRVDAVLSGSQLSARILLDRTGAEAFVTSKLSVLSESLSARGYTVQTLSAASAAEEVVTGEDLKSRTIPQHPLINVNA